jgi:hypothetical protein
VIETRSEVVSVGEVPWHSLEVTAPDQQSRFAAFADLRVFRVVATTDGLAIAADADLRAACGREMELLLRPILEHGLVPALVLRRPVPSPVPAIAQRIGLRKAKDQLAQRGIRQGRWGAVKEIGHEDRRDLATVVLITAAEIVPAFGLAWGASNTALILLSEANLAEFGSLRFVDALVEACWPERAGRRVASVDVSRLIERRAVMHGDAPVIGIGSHDDPDRQLVVVNAPSALVGSVHRTRTRRASA